jgi:hypothetical protein
MESSIHIRNSVVYSRENEVRSEDLDESRPLPLPLESSTLPAVLLELQPGMAKAVDICFECWKVHIFKNVLKIQRRDI